MLALRRRLVRVFRFELLPGLLALILLSGPVYSDGIAIVATEMTDNGDDDGFADTFETVSLRLTVQNTTEFDLHDVILRLSTTVPEIACISRPLVYLGTLAADETRRASDVFVFTVGEIDRTSLGLDEYDDLTVSFDVHVSADVLGEPAVNPTITVDVDLDVFGGSGRTTFLEAFESGTMGGFSNLNLDAGLNSLTASDGYRCQYHDPDWPNSNSYGQITDCFLGATPQQADATFWHADGNRGYSGNYSLYYGIELDFELGYTTPLAVLEAAGLTDPVNLAWGRVCEGDGITECVDEFDCPNGDRCVDTHSTLSFKHQVDLNDARSCCAPWDHASDRGVVQLQLADGTDQPVGHWIKLQPYLNVYDQTGIDNYYNCTFDPIDDGNTEVDFFDPTDPYRRLGPSSTCKPELIFAHLGDTDAPFDPLDLGNADGPGLQGATGLGTWVESKVNLNRFRGRRIRLRFLATSIKSGTSEMWESVFSHNPSPGDDGWWIDDVMITDTLTTPAVISSDSNPNTSLPGFDDGDGDGEIDACDTCPDVADPTQADEDRDGLGEPCDNCPTVPNPVQADTDMDGLGDLCDRCPDGDSEDDDLDSIACFGDNCPLRFNPDQSDADDDLMGDACDDCPADAENDLDADGICGDVDNCDTLFNSNQTGVVRLSGELQWHGQIHRWEVSDDARTVAYVADQDMDEVFELYSVPITGGSPTKLNGEMTAGGDVEILSISPDDQRVVYRADQETNEVRELYSVPITGGLPTKLNGEMTAGGDVWGFSISPDGQRVVYRADQETNDVVELYGAPIAGGSAIKLSGPMAPEGDVRSWPNIGISPDSQRVVYRADQDADEVFELYSVPTTGGSPTKLNGEMTAGGFVRGFSISPDGERVVYRADQETYEVFELYSVPITGGLPTKLNGETASGEYSEFSISPDGQRVVYQATGGLYSAPITGGLPTNLNGEMTAGGSVRDFSISPDGERVVYRADQETNDVVELYSVPITGGTTVKLSDESVDGIDVAGFLISPDSQWVVVLETLWHSYRVSIEGGASVKLGDAGQVGPCADWGCSTSISSGGQRVVYTSGPGYDIHFDLYSVSMEGGTAVRLNDPLPPGGGVTDMTVSPDGESVVYLADQLETDVKELFSAAIDGDPDGDGDGLLQFCDTCPEVANPDQSEDTDFDQDGLDCRDDNCPLVANADQTDRDSDGLGDPCDPCPDYPWNDADGDGMCGDVDPCPFENPDDADGDGLCCPDDNCCAIANPLQTDTDGDGIGEVCDPCPLDPLNDADADGYCSNVDNCPQDANSDQFDVDSDGLGDVCDNCLNDANPDQADTDGDHVGTVCDNCPVNANPTQSDVDSDGIGDACDLCPLHPINDPDDDGHCGDVDNCPNHANPDQSDLDSDELGDACDPCTDLDGDGFGHPGLTYQICPRDNCPETYNPSQIDSEFTPVELRQWASSAVASSEWTSVAYAAREATGPPEFPGVCADEPTNWSPLTETADPEWIQLTFPDSVLASSVVVHEMIEAPFVYQVDVIDGTGQTHTVWTGEDTTVCGEGFEPTWTRTTFGTKRVVVRTRAPNWEEVDAVELIGYRTSPDGNGDVCDNCPRVHNILQVDTDGDGQGDDCDCAPSDPDTRSPADVPGLRIDEPSTGSARLTWTSVPGADSYAIHRGVLSSLDPWSYGSCLTSVAATTFDDSALPDPGAGWFYIVVGESATCGRGSLGFDATGRERIEVDPSVCP